MSITAYVRVVKLRHSLLTHDTRRTSQICIFAVPSEGGELDSLSGVHVLPPAYCHQQRDRRALQLVEKQPREREQRDYKQRDGAQQIGSRLPLFFRQLPHVPEGRAALDAEVRKYFSVKDLGNTPAKTIRTGESFGSEAALETAIEAAKQRMCAAPTRPEKMAAWREMVRLIDRRTPSRIRFMARMRGLA